MFDTAKNGTASFTLALVFVSLSIAHVLLDGLQVAGIKNQDENTPGQEVRKSPPCAVEALSAPFYIDPEILLGEHSI